MNKNKKITISIILSLIILPFILLKIRYMFLVPLWFDEGFTFFYTQSNSFYDLINRMFMYELNPFLFYFLEWVITGLFNSYEPQILRLLPFLFSILSPFAIYFLYKECFVDAKSKKEEEESNIVILCEMKDLNKNLNGAIIAAIFLFISSFYTFITVDARAYSTAIFFCIMGVLYYFRLLRGAKNSFILFCLFWILAIYTHFLSLILVTVLFFHYVINLKFNKEIFSEKSDNFITGKNNIFIAFLLIYISFLPNIIELQSVSNNLAFWPGIASFNDILELFYVSITGYGLLFPHMAIWFSITFISIILFLSSLFIKDKNKNNIYLFIAMFVTVFLSTFIISKYFSKNVFSIRHMVIILPFFSIIIAYTLSHIKQNWLKIALFMIIFFINLSSTINLVYKPELQRNDFKTVSSILRQNLKQDDLIILNHGYQKFLLLYYMPELSKSKNVIFIEKMIQNYLMIK